MAGNSKFWVSVRGDAYSVDSDLSNVSNPDFADAAYFSQKRVPAACEKRAGTI